MGSGFLLRRLLLAIPTLAGVAVIVFILLRVVPGDPIAMMIPPGAGAEDIERLRSLYGLDRSIPAQFGLWVADLARGDLGTSISLRQGVVGLILDRLPATLELALVAALMAILLGGSSAVAAAYWRGRWPERSVDALGGFVLAVPDFLWGLGFILVLGVLVPLLPISGRLDPRQAQDFATGFFLLESVLRLRVALAGDLLRHITLPALALALPLAAMIARVLKAALIEALAQDYAQMAAALGYSRLRIVLVEALRNALVPTVTLTAVQLTFLVGGTVLIERIFAWPGIGNMAIAAVIDRDLPLIQGLILTFALLFIAINLIVDAAYRWLDPRLRHA